MLDLPDIDERLEEALNHPDIKYSSKWYSHLKYPRKFPQVFDPLLASFRPEPNALYNPAEAYRRTPNIGEITLPIYEGTPPGFPARPYVDYHDETLRWYDYWLKGIDTGILDEPPIKLFVMGINKWRSPGAVSRGVTRHRRHKLDGGSR